MNEDKIEDQLWVLRNSLRRNIIDQLTRQSEMVFWNGLRKNPQIQIEDQLYVQLRLQIQKDFNND